MSAAVQPHVPGWYQYEGASNALVFLLDVRGQWYAIADNGDSTPCDWGYIEQALGVFNLKLMTPLGTSVPTPEHTAIHSVFEVDEFAYGPTVDPRDMTRRRR